MSVAPSNFLIRREDCAKYVRVKTRHGLHEESFIVTLLPSCNVDPIGYVST